MTTSIISVHTPKVAGSSFLHQLKKLYGETAIFQDYADDPVNPLSTASMDPNRYVTYPIESILPHKIVHGHFSPKKYAAIQDALRLTFLRHPVENVISIYYFWIAHDRSAWDSPIFQYCKDKKLSLIQFAMLPSIRHLYTHTYFGGFDMGTFDFVGNYSRYDEELTRLGGLLGVHFDPDVRLNTTKGHYLESARFENEREKTRAEEYTNLTRILEDDIRFYEKHTGK